MKTIKWYQTGWLYALLLLLMSACKDDDYHYPSVQLEFVTVEAGADGKVETLIPDSGDPLPVSNDRSNSSITANSRRRALSQYVVVGSGVTATADIYSLQSPIVPVPKPADDPAFKNGIKHDPVDVTSIWMGRNYLNIRLEVKVNTGKGHVFGIVEDRSKLDSDGIVTLLLYYDNGGDAEYYNRDAYLSVPLSQYVSTENPQRKLTVQFEYYTRDASGTVVESDKYATPGFEYVPDVRFL
jgi:hypothetical protein